MMAATTVAPEAKTPAAPVAPPVEKTRMPVGVRARAGTARVGGIALTRIRRLRWKDLFEQVPKSVAWQARYAKAGGWVPGEQAQWLEFFGRVYGFVIAVPVTAAGFLAIWFVQRPTRVVFGIILWCALRWAL